MRKMKKVLGTILLCLCLLLSACDSQVPGSQTSSSVRTSERVDGTPGPTVTFATDADVTVAPGIVETPDGKSADIVLTGKTATCSSDAVRIDGDTVTITDEGTYLVNGTLENGQIIVDAEKTDKVEIILNGADITSATSAAIYVRQADKLTLTCAKDSVNSLKSGGEYIAIDENNIDAAVFSKDDLTLKGEGTLAVSAAAGHGIVTKDDLKINSGTYIIVAAGHGLCANDSIEASDATLSVTAGKDGLQAEHDDDATLGNILLENINLKVEAGGDGISASGTLGIQSGYYELKCGGGSGVKLSSASGSAKGIKSTGVMTLEGGTFTIDSADDAIHANADILISDGYYTLSTGDDGVHADETVTVSGGTLNVLKSYEGLEGLHVEITGGTLSLRSSDDGINAAGGMDQSGMGGGRPGGDRFGPGGMWGGMPGSAPGTNSGATGGVPAESCSIVISGGTICVNADGDGIDSNGTLEVSGGAVDVSGPTNSGNGALDFDGSGTITGGIVVAVGAAGMAQNFTSATQGSLLLNVGNQAAGSEVSLRDSDGNVLVSYRTESAYATVVISCPEIVQGGQYTVSAGTFTQDVTVSSLIYGSSMGGIGGRPR